MKRERVLSDDEIRAVWKAAEANGQYGAFVRLALLTAQRRDKIASMKWEDVSADSTWTIATEAREKGNPGELRFRRRHSKSSKRSTESSLARMSSMAAATLT